MQHFFKKAKFRIIIGLSSSLLVIHTPRTHRSQMSNVYIHSSLVHRTQRWTHPAEWASRMWCSHITEYYSALKKERDFVHGSSRGEKEKEQGAGHLGGGGACLSCCHGHHHLPLCSWPGESRCESWVWAGSREVMADTDKFSMDSVIQQLLKVRGSKPVGPGLSLSVQKASGYRNNTVL